MLDPRHECYWVRRKRSELFFTAGQLNGTGISLRVWLDAIGRGDSPWYSVRYGEHEDNVLALRLAGHPPREVGMEARDVDGPLAESTWGLFCVIERPLTVELRAALGISLDQEQLPAVGGDLTEVLASHDDCFVSFAPADQVRRARVVDSVLELHSFYLGTQIDWSPIRAELQEIVAGECEVRLKSDARRQRLLVRWGRPSVSERLSGRADGLAIDVRDGVAVVQERIGP